MILSPLKNAICLKDVGYLLWKWQCNHKGTGTSLSGDFSQMWLLVKSTKIQYLGLEAKMEKVRPLYFLKLLKLQKIKYHYFFHFWPLSRDIEDLWFLPVFTFGWNPLKVESLFPNDCTAIFKGNNQYPSDILRFLGVTKS